MSDRINLYLHGDLEAIANHLSGDNCAPLDTVDSQALLTNICRRLDRLTEVLARKQDKPRQLG